MGYPEYKKLELPKIAEEIRQFWKENETFRKSITSREGKQTFTFYEGPPSANGKPGIHHVMARTIKDIFCRFKTQQGYHVQRKGGWDTHGLPVELQVEKRMNLNKDDIGDKISVEDFNKECRQDVMKFKEHWDELTEQIGFWLDLDDPYITYDSNYIESVWYLLKQFHEKDLLYRDYSIQPYSPAAGTNLSAHELGQPGCYRPVKDLSVTAQFKVKNRDNTYILAWTTTPWTLPSNAALGIHRKLESALVNTINPYSGEPVKVILAEKCINDFFDPELKDVGLDSFKKGNIKVPWSVEETFPGSELEGTEFEQLLPYVTPESDKAFKVYHADFVTTDEGTGVVHIAPTFGADDYRIAKEYGIPPITVPDPNSPGEERPLVDKEGKFVDQVSEFAGRYVKDFGQEEEEPVDVSIVVKLKKENKAFRSEKYEHNYPHCWRTDKPVIYYPMESWFIRVSQFRDKLLEHNNTINWNPESTGTGRFGNWLESLTDWNLSRTRYWATPLPVWQTEDKTEQKCIGSYEELKNEVEKSVSVGFMQEGLSDDFDPHIPYVDEIVLVSSDNKPMHRVSDVIDVWFDSGAMPYAQHHYPFENQEQFQKTFPADFIAEGVDQTRGWFYTLHAIAVLLFDSVAFKNVIANGLVLDKHGNKMSKRLGNVIDPFETMRDYGPDATRWYMVHNAPPWENLKFDLNGIDETRKKLFGTLFNTYSFFALYANIDGFQNKEEQIPFEQRPELDRWIISRLNTLISEVEKNLEEYDPTRAVRKIQDFVLEHLSNWYVRLSRRRFWKGDYSENKISAYQTLYRCLKDVSKLMAPFSPFYAEQLFRDLQKGSGETEAESVHLAYWPEVSESEKNSELEEKMELAQRICSLALALRKKAKIRVRQPLNKIIVPAENQKMQERIEAVRELILNEINVKEIEFPKEEESIIVKKVKPDFKKLGPTLGKKIKVLKEKLENVEQKDIEQLEKEGSLKFDLDGEDFELNHEDVDILYEDIPGQVVESDGKLTVAMDVNITPELENEGLARELINRIQNIRKNNGFEVTDQIIVQIEDNKKLQEVVSQFEEYICSETLTQELNFSRFGENNYEAIELGDISTKVSIKRT